MLDSLSNVSAVPRERNSGRPRIIHSCCGSFLHGRDNFHLFGVRYSVSRDGEATGLLYFEEMPKSDMSYEE